MSITPQLLPIDVNSEKKINTILTNIIKMLTNRNLLKKTDLEDNIKKILSIQTEESLYEIKLDNPELYYKKEENNETNIMYIKYLNQKITGVKRSSPIGEFLFLHKNHPKIIIINSITQKAKDQIHEAFPNSEIFLEKDLMIDIISHVSMPKFELLSEDESKLVLEEYSTRKREMPKIYVTDPCSRYYNAQPGRIFRVLRPSEITAYSVIHRLVISGNYLNH